MNFVGSSTSDLLMHLPAANVSTGRMVSTKKNISENEVWVSDNGSPIDHTQQVILNSGDLGYINVMSNGQQCYMTGSKSVATSVASDNLVLWIPFDEGSGDSLTNYASSGLTVSRSNFEDSGNGWVTGVTGNAMKADEVSDEQQGRQLPAIHLTSPSH